MGNPGTLSGINNTVGTYDPMPKRGSWSGNRGRVSIDEIRMWGYPNDGGQQANGHAGGAKMVNTNSLRGASSLFYPGDIGSVMNILSGTVYVNGGKPFNALYNTAGTVICSTSGAGAPACFENNTEVRNAPGAAVNLMNLFSGSMGTLYTSDGAACSTGSGNAVCFGCDDAFQGVNGGTISITQADSYQAGLTVNTGATVTTRTGYRVLEASVGGGTLTTQYGVDIPLLTAATTNTGIRIGSGGQTLTANPGAQIDLWQGTTTLNFASAAVAPFVNFTGTLSLQQSAPITGLAQLVNASPTIKNKNGSAVSLGIFNAVNAAPLFQADGATVATIRIQTMFNSAPATGVINAGVISAGQLISFNSGLTVGASTTISYGADFVVNDAVVGGTLTTHVGVDVATLSASTTNIGIRNAATTVYTPPSAQALVAGTTVASGATEVRVNSSASITLTATPTITAGQEGQFLIILCTNTTAARTITFQSNGTLAGSNLSLGATTRAVGPRGSLTLVYSVSLGYWVEVGFNPGNFG